MTGRYAGLPAGSRPWRVRAENDRLADSARKHHFDDYAPVPFLCECDSAGCSEFVRITLSAYDEWHVRFMITAPAHDILPVRRAVTTRSFSLYPLPPD